MLQTFTENNVNVTYRHSKNLKELISPSLFPRTIKKTTVPLKNVRCSTCKNFVLVSTEFIYHDAKCKYKIRILLNCNKKYC